MDRVVICCGMVVFLAVAGCQSSPLASMTQSVPFLADDHSHWTQYGPSAQEQMERLTEIRQSAASAGPDEQKRITDELARQIAAESNALIRRQIVHTISAFSAPMAGAVLQAALRDEDRDVRIAACEALAKRGGPQAAQLLAGMVREDKDIDVRLAAAKSLQHHSDPASFAALHATLQDPDPALRRRAAESLETLSGDESISWHKNPAASNAEGPSLAQRLFWWQ